MHILNDPVYLKRSESIEVGLTFNRPYLAYLVWFPEVVCCIDSAMYCSNLFSGLNAVIINESGEYISELWCQYSNYGYINKKSKKLSYEKKEDSKWRKTRNSEIRFVNDTLVYIYIDYPKNIRKGTYELFFVYNLLPNNNMPNGIPNRYFEGYFESDRVKLIVK